MVKYVERGGEQVFAAPFRQTGTRLRAWPLWADRGALQRLCDRYFNEPSGGAVDYRALFPFVLLAVAPIEATRALTPPDSGYGYTPETDVAFWIPIARGHVEKGVWKLDKIVWFLPYVWVDVPTTMATGREVYGYPKELAYLEGPAGEDDSLVLHAETMVLPVHEPTTELVRAPILEIRRGARGKKALGSIAEAFAELITQASNLDRDLRRALECDLLGLEVSMVFLKQFRDIVDPTAACYQAIIESPARVERISGGSLLIGPTTIAIWDYASHPIARDLGLGTPSGGKLVLTSRFGFEVDFDFIVDLGTVIWQAT